MVKSSYISIWKNVGETPLEALERFRGAHPELKDDPMTYAGRLDPMAEGELLILIGDECKNKETYLGLDKEYEVEVIFGISTDTHDALGLATMMDSKDSQFKLLDLQKYVGTFEQEYPAFSSRTVKGVPLHVLARTHELPEEMPTKEVEIYSVERIGSTKITGAELKNRIVKNIDMVRGDFRQEEIKKRWGEVLANPACSFECLSIRVRCTSGTYIRSLARRIGEHLGVGAFALSIKRTKILGV